MPPPPSPFFTVIMPSCTFHCAGEWPSTDTHSSTFLPSNSTTASEGGSVQVAPGVTTFGSGLQTSVSSGLVFAVCWAKNGMLRETRLARTKQRAIRVLIVEIEHTPPDGAESVDGFRLRRGNACCVPSLLELH